MYGIVREQQNKSILFNLEKNLSTPRNDAEMYDLDASRSDLL